MTTSTELAFLFPMLTLAAAGALLNLAERARQEGWSYQRFCEVLLATQVV